MNRRNFFTLMVANLAWFLLPGCGRKSSLGPAVAPSSPASGTASSQAKQRQEVLNYEEQNQAKLAAARKRAAQQHRMAEAVAKTPEYRRQLQLDREGAWQSLINKYTPTFLTLRLQAAHSSDHYVECTICKGTGQLDFCVMCDSTGVCPTCHGKGRLMDDSICPTCQGSGKCFLCAGTGKMQCPFCDDGLLYANQPLPPQQIPIH